MAKKHINALKRATSQKAQQSAARRAAQVQRGSIKFKRGSNPHIGGSRAQTQPKR